MVLTEEKLKLLYNKENIKEIKVDKKTVITPSAREYMAQKSIKLIEESKIEENNKIKIPIEASGRHIHLSQKEADILFGTGYVFTVSKELSQLGQYAYKERVRLIGSKGIIENVVILGPMRKETQVELSLTDSRILGVNAVLRNSGLIDGTPGILMSNGKNFVYIDKGVIIARNHIHMNEKDANRLNVKDNDLIKVKIVSERSGIFENVLVRVDNKFILNMHIDYDEANAFYISKDSYGEIYE